jgi:hypothetical protein
MFPTGNQHSTRAQRMPLVTLFSTLALTVCGGGGGGYGGRTTTTPAPPPSVALSGSVTESGGPAFAVPGLWGIAFGNDAASQPRNTLFFSAGTSGEDNGSYGRIDLPHCHWIAAQRWAFRGRPICRNA